MNAETGTTFEVIDGGAGDESIRRRPAGACRHRRSRELVASSRRAFCGDCGAELDLFDLLLDVVRRRERYAAGARRAREEMKEVEARLDDLKRREKNARARVRRLEAAR